MARIRTLKPDINSSPQVMNLSRDARLLFFGLILRADDEGRGTADARKLKGQIFPGDDDIGAQRVTELLSEIEAQQLVVTYDGNGHGRLYCLPTFTAHQYIQKRKPSVYPAPPGHPPMITVPIPDQDDTRTVGLEGIGIGIGIGNGNGSDARAHANPVDNGNKSSRSARSPGRLKQSSAEEIERKRSEAAEICKRLAQGAKIP